MSTTTTTVPGVLPREFFAPSSGPCIFTVQPSGEWLASRPDCQQWYTYRLVYRAASDDGKWPECVFAGLLTGPDNRDDYTYLGVVDLQAGTVRLTRASKYAETSWPVLLLRRVLLAYAQGRQQAIADAGWSVRHEGYCGVCGRALTVPESIERGIGPECWRRRQGGVL